MKSILERIQEVVNQPLEIINSDCVDSDENLQFEAEEDVRIRQILLILKSSGYTI